MDIEQEFDTEMKNEVIGLFEEDGTAFECVACGGWGEVIIEESGIDCCPGVYSGHWFSGYIKCCDCGATESYCDSSV